MNDDLDWILNHLGEDRPSQYGAVSPPLQPSAMFCYPSVATLREALTDELANPFYTRGNNPTVETLRAKLAALEGAEDALVFSSGSAAVAAAVIDQVGQGDEVLCVAGPYSWTAKLLTRLLPRFGVTARFVSGGRVKDFEQARSGSTRMIVLESPASLTFETQDIDGIARWAAEHQLVSLCDNSYATPLVQRPLDAGIDLVAHSATKYLNGHSDVVAGVLCGDRERIRSVFQGPFMTLGACIGPFEAWLLMRGLRTLPLRLERVRASTRKVLAFLSAHESVRRVHQPPEPVLNGLFSIELATDEVAGTERFCDALERFLLTCSWGGYESLVYPLCVLTGSENYDGGRDLPPGLVRVSIGLEDPDLLIADLGQALDRIGT